MTPEINTKLEAYAPKIEAEQWGRLRPLALALVRRADPESESWAMAILAALVKYMVWAEKKGIPLAEANLLDERVIGWFLSDAEFGTESTRDSYGSALVRVVTGSTGAGRALGRRQPLSAPYTQAEQEALLALGGRQARKRRAVRVEALVRLGLGAGLSPQELRSAVPDDIEEFGGVVAIRVGEGESSRRIGILAEHGPRMVELAEEARTLGMTYLVGGSASPRFTNSISALVKKLNGTDDTPTLTTPRLRATWLVTQLRARTPYDVILAAVGRGAGTRLAELLVWVPELSEEERIQAQVEASKRAVGQGEAP